MKALHAMLLYLTRNRKPIYISYKYLPTVVECIIFDVHNNIMLFLILQFLFIISDSGSTNDFNDLIINNNMQRIGFYKFERL